MTPDAASMAGKLHLIGKLRCLTNLFCMHLESQSHHTPSSSTIRNYLLIEIHMHVSLLINLLR